MANVAVVGAQWGDEGKGKIVDWLSNRADMVVRFQGGHNAGHTLVVDGKVYKLALLPSGVVQGKPSIIGNGVVVDPWHLVGEIEKIAAQGVAISPDILTIADNACLILPIHPALDVAREAAASAPGAKIGTTGRGIGPAYEDKVGRRAIRVCDLANADDLKVKIDRLRSHHDPLRAGLGLEPIDPEALLAQLLEIAPKILPYVKPAWRVLDQAQKAGKRVLFEGAQGAFLDVDHGTYPYVTSSNTVAGQAAAGSGIGPRGVGYVLGIVKAYTTRVGEGPFACELDDEVGRHLATVGREVGVNTGRARLVRRGAGAPVGGDQRHRRHRPDQAGRAGRIEDAEDLRRLSGQRRGAGLSAQQSEGPGGGGAGVRGAGRLEREHGRGPQLQGHQRQRHQICAADRGADRRAGGPAVDQPRAGRHHIDA